MEINVERDLKNILIKKLELDTYLEIVKYVQGDGKITGDSDEAKNFKCTTHISELEETKTGRINIMNLWKLTEKIRI